MSRETGKKQFTFNQKQKQRFKEFKKFQAGKM